MPLRISRIVLGLSLLCGGAALTVLWRPGGLFPERTVTTPPSANEDLLQALLETDGEPQPVGKSISQDEPGLWQAKETTTANPNVRVALFRQFPLKTLESKGSSRCHLKDGSALKSLDLANWAGGGVRCQSLGGDGIAVNGATYQGMIEVTRSENGWLAINQLELEHYVASVVGAEMPSHWNNEALKAQAVAARSYALVHLVRPAASRYHLGDTTRWQTYGGERTITRSTRQASAATLGEVLSFRGGLVESLYASTSQVSAEAHGHLGASMSQHGAQALAQQGKTYDQILGRYYKGASLARIKLHGP